MKTGSPSLKAKPSALARLAALEEWTEEPAAEAANAVKNEAGQGVQHAEVAAARPQKKPKKAPEGKKTSQELPPEIQEIMRQIAELKSASMTTQSYRIPTQTYIKLKYLAETTYGLDMSTIMRDALVPHVEKLWKGRGLP